MGLLWEILKAPSKENDKKKKQQNEKEMDAFGLEDWQKDLVRKGEYDSWNFEESGDLEENDFYYDDDK